MKIIAVNGSPRKNWNTDTLLRNVLDGAASAGAETEMVYLYDLNFKGCKSCMACKLKKEPRPNRCILRDDLTAGLIGFSMSNTCPLIAVTGAAAAGIGNNPFAYAAPAGRYRAILFDVCMSVVASGKLIIAAADKKPIPEGWILDKHGKPTTDPAQIWDGAIMLPFGNHKGYGLAVMVELLSGVLADAGVLSGVHSWNTVPGEDANTGHFFMTINPEFFTGLDAFVSRTEKMIEELVSAPKADKVDHIYYPGEIEFKSEERGRKEGLELPAASLNELERAEKLLK